MTYYNTSPSGIIVFNPLETAQTQYHVSEYLSEYGSVNVVDYYKGLANTVWAAGLFVVSEINDYQFSVPQSDVTINVSNEGFIWITGYYTPDEKESFYYFDPPYGNDITKIPFKSGYPPPKKLVYKLEQLAPEGNIVYHQINVRAGLINYYIYAERFVYHNIYYAYRIFLEYEWYASQDFIDFLKNEMGVTYVDYLKDKEFDEENYD